MAEVSASPAGTLQILEWPQEGRARRFPRGGWWVVEYRPGRGYTPLEGPWRTREEAATALEVLQQAQQANP